MKYNKLKKAEEFDLVFSKGRKLHTPYLTFITLKSQQLEIGIVTSKKVAKSAVVRNNIKRQVKSILQSMPETTSKYKLVISSKPDFVNLSFEAKKEFVIKSLGKILETK